MRHTQALTANDIAAMASKLLLATLAVPPSDDDQVAGGLSHSYLSLSLSLLLSEIFRSFVDRNGIERREQCRRDDRTYV